jgi:Ran GTPase-activating protein (RanGAP) involved in mRNA processing and transport
MLNSLIACLLLPGLQLTVRSEFVSRSCAALAIQETRSPSKSLISGWSSEEFALPPGFAPSLPLGTESLRFAPGWNKPEAEGFWSYAFVMRIEEPKPDAARVDSLLETYYNGLVKMFAEGKHEVGAAPARVELKQVAVGRYVATMRTIDAFATFKPIAIRLLVDTVADGPARSSLRVQLSPQPESHPIWKSLQAAIEDILAKHLGDISPQERAVVESTIRKHLNLPEGATISAGHLAKVTQLDLSQQPISDASLTWVSNPATGFSALTTLNLQNTKVTDAGIAALANKSTGLKKLNTLMLASTSITDVGLNSISQSESGLKNLTTLDLRSTLVTNEGVIALSRADTGLIKLTILDLSFTKVTDDAIKHLSRSDTGVKHLITLGLASTQVADSSLINLARKQTGLKALRVLNLAFTRITDVGLRAASAPDTGLSKLRSLFLYGTRLTNSGVKDIAQANSGLRALTLLDIGSTTLTDAGLKELARPASGLKFLSKLHIRDTKVTDSGVSLLRTNKPKIEVIR